MMVLLFNWKNSKMNVDKMDQLSKEVKSLKWDLHILLQKESKDVGMKVYMHLHKNNINRLKKDTKKIMDFLNMIQVMQNIILLNLKTWKIHNFIKALYKTLELIELIKTQHLWDIYHQINIKSRIDQIQVLDLKECLLWMLTYNQSNKPLKETKFIAIIKDTKLEIEFVQIINLLTQSKISSMIWILKLIEK
jgi:hypothetical protein